MNDDHRFDPVDDELRRRFAGVGPAPAIPTRCSTPCAPACSRPGPDAAPRSPARRRRSRCSWWPCRSPSPAGAAAVRCAPRRPRTTACPSPIPRWCRPPRRSSRRRRTAKSRAGPTEGERSTVRPNPPRADRRQRAELLVRRWLHHRRAHQRPGLVGVELARRRLTAEIHDNGPTRVEVRFSDGQTEWRIRIELGGGGLTSEITQHG